MVYTTEYVALDQYLTPTMNNNSLIQIDSPEKGKCGLRAESSSAHNHHEASLLTSQFSQEPRVMWEQGLSSHNLELDANKIDVTVSNAGDVSLTDEGEVPVSFVVFAQALSDNR